MCVCVGMGTLTCRPQRNVNYLPLEFSTLFARQGLPVNLTHCFGEAGRKMSSQEPPVLDTNTEVLEACGPV